MIGYRWKQKNYWGSNCMDEKVYLLFQYNHDTKITNERKLPSGCKLIKFTPTLKDILRKKVSFTEYFWYIITAHNYVLYCVMNDKNEVIHKSTRIGKCYKFNFLKKNEYEIGPCYTSESFRGKGIYPFVLNQIISDNPNANYYMFIDEKNFSSIRGVEKAGFMLIGQIKRCSKGIWKRI